MVNFEKETNHYTQTLLSRCKEDIFEKLEIIHVKPWGVASGALNIGFNEAFTNNKKPDQILIASKEVEFNKSHIKKMSEILNNNVNMLVVGLALRAKLENLSEFETGHSFEYYVSDALRVPWNTCAMWDSKLFLENVKSFLNVCDYPEILGVKTI
ncbi:MAG: hypothetical protein MUO82_02495 [Candidatus Thermoplasmatota archaeon]|nr:hypothetical protein [Candidatus Thermoplasmatota archaeon]